MLTMASARRLGITCTLAVLLLLCCASTAGATFPGRNGEIVISSWPQPVESPAFDSSLTFINPRTGRARRLALCPAVRIYPSSQCEGRGAAAVSPDGQEFAFVMGDGTAAYHAPTRYLLSVLPHGGGPAVKHALIDRPQDPVYPSYDGLRWSPDGSRLVLDGWEDEGTNQLSFVRTDGRLTGRIIKNASSPDWSPDGRLAFVRYANPFDTQSGDLFVGKPSGRFRRLTRKGGDGPSWSPDSRKIAFSRDGGISLVSSRGGKARRLVKHGPLVETFGGPPTYAYSAVAPVWSPDGKQLVFIRAFHRRQNSYVYTLNLRTKKLRLLNAGIQPSDQVFSLDWRPLPAPSSR